MNQESNRELAIKEAQASQAEVRQDLRWLMSERRGRRIVWRLLSDAGVFQLSFHTNAMQMAFNEGIRNKGLKMLNDLLANCPELYTRMVEEANERNTSGRKSDN